ncbi:hypothetical protein BT93_H1105 [Corymbia citriodora subsp. variegata]|nr:hypothetical protein BT93_H1105 [Corymbia citriodora subsp. variegata]
MARTAIKGYNLTYVEPLSLDDEPVVEFTEEVLDAMDPKWNECVVGYFVGKRLPFKLVETALKHAWGGFFFFWIPDVDFRRNILDNGPITVARLTNDNHAKVPVWIWLRNIPFSLWSALGISGIASAIGIPLYFCEEISTTNKKIDKVRVKLNGVTRGVLVEYEWRPVICNKCSCFGHKCKEMDASNAGQVASQDAAPISITQVPPAISNAGHVAIPAPAGSATMPQHATWFALSEVPDVFNKEGVVGVAAQQGVSREDETSLASLSHSAVTEADYSNSAAAPSPLIYIKRLQQQPAENSKSCTVVAPPPAAPSPISAPIAPSPANYSNSFAADLSSVRAPPEGSATADLSEDANKPTEAHDNPTGDGTRSAAAQSSPPQHQHADTSSKAKGGVHAHSPGSPRKKGSEHLTYQARNSSGSKSGQAITSPGLSIPKTNGTQASGMVDPVRQAEVRSFVHTNNLSCVGLIETKFLGLLINTQIIHGMIRILQSSSTLFISAVYGEHTCTSRRPLWNGINFLSATLKESPWVVVGDFNAIRDPSDRVGGSDNWILAFNEFGECLSHAELEDLRYVGFRYTWSTSSGEHRKQRKIDRVLVNSKWASEYSFSEAAFLALGISNHTPMSARTTSSGLLWFVYAPQNFQYQ